MVTCADFWGELSAPFPSDAVHWRVGATNRDKDKGMALAYIDARDVMQRLDTVLGPAGWQCDYPHANGKTVCTLRCWVPRGAAAENVSDCDFEWIAKSDGAGDTDYEGVKGALSDSFKRSAVRFGVGRYLYDLSTPWLEIKQQGKSFVFTEDSYKQLERYLKTAVPGSNGTNQERIALRLLCKSLDYMGGAEAILQFKEEKRSEIAALSKGNQQAFADYIETKLKKMKAERMAAE